MKALSYREATLADAPLLARLNQELLEDEGHRLKSALAELQERMHRFLQESYRAVLFENEGEPVAYALFRDEDDSVYLRQFYVVRAQRRRGFGRAAFDLLATEVFPPKRLYVEVLIHNERARAFWQALGFAEHFVTMERLAPE